MKNSVQPLRVVCVGDSLTRGQVSVDYVKMLASRDIGGSVSFTHAGVNGAPWVYSTGIITASVAGPTISMPALRRVRLPAPSAAIR